MMHGGHDRLARALPVLAALAAVALLTSQGLAWTSVRSAAHAVDRGEASVMVASLAVHLRSLQARPTEAELQAFLESHRHEGLSFVSVHLPREDLSAGDRLLARATEPGFLREAGRVRMAQALPRPEGGSPRRPSPWGARPRRGGREVDSDGGRDWPPPPLIVIEMTPLLGAAMRTDAYRGLLGSGVAALMFLTLALALRRVTGQRAEALRAAEQHRHLATLGEMSAVIAHQIRNPLAALKGHAQLLLETVPNDARAQKKAERIVHEAKRLEDLTDSLLEFVRSGELRPEEFDLVALVWESARVVPHHGLEVTVEPDLGEVLVFADRVRLQQAIVNILVNATQVSDQPVSVHIVVSPRDVQIEIADHGPGIESGQEEAIFEPFRTTRAQGTGLGLAVAQRVVEAHGGTIRAANRRGSTGATMGHGAVFTITLPTQARRTGVV